QGTHLAGLQKHADAMGERFDHIETAATQQGSHLNSLQGAADRFGTHLGDLQRHTDEEAGLVGNFAQRLDEALKRVEAMRADFQTATSAQHILEDNNRRLDERQANDASYLRAQLSFHQRLFSHWLAPKLAATATTSAMASGAPGGLRDPLSLAGATPA